MDTREADEKSKHNYQLSQVIKTLWASLIKPAWTSDDLVALGKSIYAKQPISMVDQEVFCRLLPYLQIVGEELLQKIKQLLLEESKSPADPTTPQNKETPDASV
jgi:hypothetical protein